MRRSNWLVIFLVTILLIGGIVLFLLLLANPEADTNIRIPTLRPTEIVQPPTSTATQTATLPPSPTQQPTLTPTAFPTLPPTPQPTLIPDTPLPDLPPLPAPVEIALGVPLFGDGVPPTYGRFGGLYDNQQLIQAGHIMINVPGDANIPSFYIDVFEVTNLQLVNFLNATQLTDMPLTGYDAEALWVDGSQSDSPIRQDEFGVWSVRNTTLDPLPARWVSALAARAYCANIGGSLPMPEQWQRAAFWTQEGERQYPWGNEPPDRTYANFANEDLMPANTLERGRSWIGTFHMGGNVAEWVQIDDHTFGFIGGSFLNDAAQFEESIRQVQIADGSHALQDVGFRCVLVG